MPLPNNILKKIERSAEYKKFKRETQAALDAQWHDLVFSGVPSKMYDYFFDAINSKKGTVTKAAKSPTKAAINRMMLQGKITSMDKLTRYVQDKVTGKMKTVGGYAGYNMSLKTYIYDLMKKGGQEELDRYLGVNKLKFTLDKQVYKDFITKRVNTLIKGLNDTTAKRMSNAIIKGMEQGLSKKEIMAKLQKTGVSMSASRAKIITDTETNAAVEYMRYETARLNGGAQKIWRTAEDEEVCGPCEDQDSVMLPIKEIFSNDVVMPPGHACCRCFLEYVYPDSMEYAEKSYSDEYEYTYDKDAVVHRFPNPNAVWAGGDELVGSDKNIRKYIEYFSRPSVVTGKMTDNFKHAFTNMTTKEIDETAWSVHEVAEHYKKKGRVIIHPETPAALKIAVDEYRAYVDRPPSLESFAARTYDQIMIIMARAELTNLGFAQLLHEFGFRRKVKANTVKK